MAKNNSMQKQVEKDEQLELIETGPGNAEEIIKAARLYKQAQNTRLSALKEELKYKGEVKRLVKKADMQPIKDGIIKFEHSGLVFCLTPRDELITIKEKKTRKSKKTKKSKK